MWHHLPGDQAFTSLPVKVGEIKQGKKNSSFSLFNDYCVLFWFITTVPMVEPEGAELHTSPHRDGAERGQQHPPVPTLSFRDGELKPRLSSGSQFSLPTLN